MRMIRGVLSLFVVIALTGVAAAQDPMPPGTDATAPADTAKPAAPSDAAKLKADKHKAKHKSKHKARKHKKSRRHTAHQP